MSEEKQTQPTRAADGVTDKSIEKTETLLFQISGAISGDDKYLGEYTAEAIRDIVKVLHSQMAIWEYTQKYNLCLSGGCHFSHYCSRDKFCLGFDSSSSSSYDDYEEEEEEQ